MRYKIQDLMDVMAQLRDPKDGCPWDVRQDFRSILPYTLEEAYEVADAIDRGDMKALREELGDLLFQSVYHAQMADEAGHFTLHDVIHDITAKMISRHPHVFGDETARNAADVNAIWDRQKEKEKEKAQCSALDGVPAALPALLRAQKLQKKAAKSGFEWKELSRVFDKLEEEIGELRAAIEAQDSENQMEELGDALFVLANLGRMLGHNAEEALRRCNEKFIKRFQGIEREIADLKSATLEDMEAAWRRQKKV